MRVFDLCFTQYCLRALHDEHWETRWQHLDILGNYYPFNLCSFPPRWLARRLGNCFDWLNGKIFKSVNFAWQTKSYTPVSQEQVHCRLELPLDQSQGIQILVISYCLWLLLCNKGLSRSTQHTTTWTSGLKAQEPCSAPVLLQQH